MRPTHRSPRTSAARVCHRGLNALAITTILALPSATAATEPSTALDKATIEAQTAVKLAKDHPALAKATEGLVTALNRATEALRAWGRDNERLTARIDSIERHLAEAEEHDADTSAGIASQADDKRSQLVGDGELRTELATLKTRVAALERAQAVSSPDEATEALRTHAARNTEGLARLTRQFQSLTDAAKSLRNEINARLPPDALDMLTKRVTTLEARSATIDGPQSTPVAAGAQRPNQERRAAAVTAQIKLGVYEKGYNDPEFATIINHGPAGIRNWKGEIAYYAVGAQERFANRTVRYTPCLAPGQAVRIIDDEYKDERSPLRWNYAVKGSNYERLAGLVFRVKLHTLQAEPC